MFLEGVALFSSLYKQVHGIHRESCMSAYVLLNLSTDLGKRDKIRGLPSILSLFATS